MNSPLPHWNALKSYRPELSTLEIVEIIILGYIGRDAPLWPEVITAIKNIEIDDDGIAHLSSQAAPTLDKLLEELDGDNTDLWRGGRLATYPRVATAITAIFTIDKHSPEDALPLVIDYLSSKDSCDEYFEELVKLSIPSPYEKFDKVTQKALFESNYTNKVFRGEELEYVTDFKYCTFTNCSFYDCSLTSTSFENCTFVDCKFINCDSTQMTLLSCRATQLEFYTPHIENINIEDCDLSFKKGIVRARNLNRIIGSSLRGVYIFDSLQILSLLISDSYISGKLDSLQLSNRIRGGTHQMRNVDLSDADVVGCIFWGIDMSSAKLPADNACALLPNWATSRSLLEKYLQHTEPRERSNLFNYILETVRSDDLNGRSGKETTRFCHELLRNDIFSTKNEPNQVALDHYRNAGLPI